MNRLSDVTVNTAAPAAARPAYDRAAIRPGVVHLGPGAFHRAHQAWYLDELLARDPRWGVTEIALKSTSVKDALAPQDGLYTLVQLGETTAYRIIDDDMREKTWATGDAFTMADCAAAPALFYADKLVPLDEHRNAAAYLARLRERPSFARVLQEAAPYFAMFPG